MRRAYHHKHVGAAGESNQLARLLFARIGFHTTLWLIEGIVALVAAIWVLVSFWANSLLLDIALVIAMTIASTAQFCVARYNATGKTNFITHTIARLYFNPSFWNKVLFWKRKKPKFK